MINTETNAGTDASAQEPRSVELQGFSKDALIAEIERLRPLAELGRMSATVAHEVRNPLTGISANAEVIREALQDPEDVESLDMILQEVQRLSDLVSDLLHYSRERDARSDHIDLSREARAVVELLRKDAAESGVILEFRGHGLAVGDSQLSRQSLLNIVRNALQACRSGGSVQLLVAPGQILVCDSGSGVPKALQETLFDPFVTGRTRGLGLGASVARRCMQRQQGDVRLRSSSETGSEFLMTWPQDN